MDATIQDQKDWERDLILNRETEQREFNSAVQYCDLDLKYIGPPEDDYGYLLIGQNSPWLTIRFPTWEYRQDGLYGCLQYWASYNDLKIEYCGVIRTIARNSYSISIAVSGNIQKD